MNERPDTSLECHPVHLPVALYEIDRECDYNATCHCRKRSEIEYSQ